MNLPATHLSSNSSSFPKLSDSAIDALDLEYKKIRSAMDDVYELIDESSILYSLLPIGTNNISATIVDKKFCVQRLDSKYWLKLINLSGIASILPSTEFERWLKQIEKLEAPEFNRENILSTVTGWYESEGSFIIDRADTIFHSLSSTHITNRPEGFGKRMIISDIWGGGFIKSDNLGPLRDLRWLIGMVSGRKGMKTDRVSGILDIVEKNNGQWVSADGESWRLRGYVATGTLHIEIHPDMAWQLNLLLSKKYPMAIPGKFIKKPKQKENVRPLQHDLLPMDVISALFGAKKLYMPKPGTHGNVELVTNGVSLDKAFEKLDPDNFDTIAAINKIVESIGGMIYPTTKIVGYVFPYDAIDVLKTIALEGRLPEKQSYQYFPTPPVIAREAISLANVGANDQSRWAEFSAGTGSLADLMPKDRTLCVEISPIYASLLKTKGFNVLNSDFLKLDSNELGQFDRVVINPPFSGKQWLSHVNKSIKLLAKSGILVAVLPTGAASQISDSNPDHLVTVHSTHKGEFDGTNVSIDIISVKI